MTPSAIVLVIDRLSASCLGPYGNTWIPTPNFNALAARSLLLDNCFADSPELGQAYDGYWHGKHALEISKDRRSIIPSIASQGARTICLTDDVSLANSPAADAFDETLLLELGSPTESAGDIDQTILASFFAEAIQVLQAQREPFLLWIHTQGLADAWDAPLSLRQALAAEDDPEALNSIDVPSRRLDDDFDPDELLGIAQAYAAQVMVLDECLGVFLQAIEQHPLLDKLLTMVTSPRGFPLGEHRIVGDSETALYNELIHLPLFLWRGDGQGALLRHRALTQSPDVAATLLNWFEESSRQRSGFASSLLPLTAAASAGDCHIANRDRIVSTAAGQTAIRTPAWFMTQRSAESAAELYRKPDDRWEVNDVATRCPQIVEQLTEERQNYTAAVQGGTLDQLAPLPDELMEGIE